MIILSRHADTSRNDRINKAFDAVDELKCNGDIHMWQTQVTSHCSCARRVHFGNIPTRNSISRSRLSELLSFTLSEPDLVYFFLMKRPLLGGFSRLQEIMAWGESVRWWRSGRIHAGAPKWLAAGAMVRIVWRWCHLLGCSPSSPDFSIFFHKTSMC